MSFKVEIDGRWRTIQELADEAGISYSAMRYRIRRGIPPLSPITTKENHIVKGAHLEFIPKATKPRIKLGRTEKPSYLRAKAERRRMSEAKKQAKQAEAFISSLFRLTKADLKRLDEYEGDKPIKHKRKK